MEMTMAEKILAEHAGGDKVTPGEVVRAEIDRAMVNDVTAPLTVDALERIGIERVWDPDRITIIFDHQAPPTTVEAAEKQAELRDFANEQKISNLYGNFEGVCHQLMVEEGIVSPGQLVVGADSHTCSYGAVGAFSTGIGSTDMAAVFAEGELWFKVPESMKINVRNELGDGVMAKDLILQIVGDVGADGATYRSIEFSGNGMKKISTSGRLSMCNMGVEMGAKAAMVPPDEETREYIKKRNGEKYDIVEPDADAEYVEELNYDTSEIEPVVSCPHNVDNVRPISEIGDIEIQQAFLGSCTNGRLKDLAVAADILRDRHVSDDVRMLVAPASRRIYQEALDRGIIDTLVDAGATMEPPGCTTCWGGHLGILASGETCVSSSNRNFKGRMGSPDAEIYLGSPATVAASAAAGKITDARGLD